MTEHEFESMYADRSGITVERLREIHQKPFPCDCGEWYCRGWQMLTVKPPELAKPNIYRKSL